MKNSLYNRPKNGILIKKHELEDELKNIPMIDAHTHLVGEKLGACGLHDILLYHMAVSDLYAAGCPQGSRLTQYPGWPDKSEAHNRILKALPFVEKVRNTSISWGMKIILNDLYDWTEPITSDNWRKLDDLIRERVDDRSWHRDILRKAGIAHSCTEIARRGNGGDDDLLDYALEWAFFTRCQWGEYDTALYELERCWGKLPGAPMPISSGGLRPESERIIQTIDDVHAAISHYVNAIPYDDVLSMSTHISTDLNLSPVTDSDMKKALTQRANAGKNERDIYASYINEAFLTKLEAQSDKIIFQFSFGAEPLPYETASRLSQKSIAELGAMISRHPKLKFQCFLASMHANQSLCTLCRELPNLSLAGYWWHNFFPSYISRIMEERLDMLPVNKQIGFFSDAYCVEWAYTKAVIIKKLLTEVLAQKISLGQYSLQDAMSIAYDIMFETPQHLLGVKIIKEY